MQILGQTDVKWCDGSGGGKPSASVLVSIVTKLQPSSLHWSQPHVYTGTVLQWSQPHVYTGTLHTVDRENFAVKIISRSRPTAKIKHGNYAVMLSLSK